MSILRIDEVVLLTII